MYEKFIADNSSNIEVIVHNVYNMYIIENKTMSTVSNELNIPLQVIKNIILNNKMVKSKSASNRSSWDTRRKLYGDNDPLFSEESRRKATDNAKITKYEKYGMGNKPLSDDAIKKREDTWKKKYGDDHPRNTKEAKAKSWNTRREKYGNNDPLHSRDSIDKAIETRRVSQYNFTQEDIAILYNKDKFKEFILNIEYSNRTPQYIESISNFSDTTILTYCKKYDILDLLNKSYRSNGERSLSDFLDSLDIEYLTNTRPISMKGTGNSLEVDILCNNIGIEFNGNYWHSDKFKDPSYHQDKSLLAKSNNIFIYHIFEYEWEDLRKRKIIEAQIKSLLNIYDNRIYARKCEVREITPAVTREFLYNNHIQGNRNSRWKYGLFYNNDLVMVMTFGYDRFIDKSNKVQLLRLCSKLGYSVVGGASKLFKYFISNNSDVNEIVSYCDISKGRGIVYNKLGFVLDKITPCNYNWIKADGNDVLSRYKCQMKNENIIMRERGYNRIFDCGSYKFVWRRTL
jgi:hypothetical protein